MTNLDAEFHEELKRLGIGPATQNLHHLLRELERSCLEAQVTTRGNAEQEAEVDMDDVALVVNE